MCKMQLFGRCIIVAFQMVLRLQSPKIRIFRDSRYECTQKQSREFERTREKSRRKVDRNFLQKKILEKIRVKTGENYVVDTVSAPGG